MRNMTTAMTSPAGVSANVSAVVRMLLAGRGDKFDILLSPLGIGRTTTFEKVAGKRKWYAEEVQALADYFELPVSVFYDGPAALLRNVANNQDYQPTLFATETPDSYQESLLETLAANAA